MRKFALYANALVIVLVLELWAAPAAACGCGGYIPRDGDASVSQERALLRWDGRSEDLVLSLDVLGSSSEAALIVPVPARATTRLADARIWSDLRRLTAPLVRHTSRPVQLSGRVGTAPGAAPVTVLDRQALGPFDVTDLAATDANELVRWLSENGYQISAGLSRTLAPYVAQGWYYVAVRLRPSSGNVLRGSLDPLWLKFDASAPVYPMRTSANATARQLVTLYVLADHRVEKSERFGASAISFAGWITPADLPQGSPLGPFVERRLFLTEFRDTVEPARVNDDFHLRFADTDATYRGEEVVYDEQPADDPSAILAVLAAVAAVAGVLLWRRRTARGQPPIGR